MNLICTRNPVDWADHRQFNWELLSTPTSRLVSLVDSSKRECIFAFKIKADHFLSLSLSKFITISWILMELQLQFSFDDLPISFDLDHRA